MIKQNDPRITAYLLGELDPAEVEVFEQAMRSSPMLAKNVEKTRQTIELLKMVFPEKKPKDSVGNANPASKDASGTASTDKTPSTFW